MNALAYHSGAAALVDELVARRTVADAAADLDALLASMDSAVRDDPYAPREDNVGPECLVPDPYPGDDDADPDGGPLPVEDDADPMSGEVLWGLDRLAEIEGALR